MTFLPADLYRQIEQSVPIVCVDFVPMRETDAAVEVGLILRESPFGRVWCHLGGRIRRGETVADALQRHCEDTLQTTLLLGDDPQPDFVYQWFPPELAPENSTPHGSDPRKHAVALTFGVVLAEGEPRPRNEAIDFGFFPAESLPEPLWPGAGRLIERLCGGQST